MPINTAVPQDGTPPEKSAIRANFQAINNKIGRLPETWAPYPAGSLICTSDESDGIVTSGDGLEPLHAGHRSMGFHKPLQVVVSSTTSITGTGHEGCLIIARNSTGIVLQVEKNVSVSAGVQHLFSCTILRPTSSGTVQIASSSLTNDHPDGHTRVGAGHMALLFVDGTSNKWYLEGATEA